MSCCGGDSGLFGRLLERLLERLDSFLLNGLFDFTLDGLLVPTTSATSFRLRFGR